MTRAELARVVASQLESPAEARWLLEDLLGDLPSHNEVPEAKRAVIDVLCARRLGGEPLQYVLGHWSFRTLDLLVDNRVLIPRPETEQVVEVALSELRLALPGRSNAVAVDLGTGSGAIALAIATEAAEAFPQLAVWASDVSGDALEVARQNSARVSQRHDGVAERVTFCQGSWWEAFPEVLKGSVDLAVSNPPYVAQSEWADLDPVVRTEPFGALVARDGSDGTPGLADVEAVLTGAADWLSPCGRVVIELAPAQAQSACGLAKALGFATAAVTTDLAGRDRVLVARR